MSKRSAVELPSSESIHAAAVSAPAVRDKVRATAGFAELPSVMRALEEAALAALAALFVSSGALPPGEAPRSFERILAGLSAAPRHTWLVRRWLAALVREELLVETVEGFTWPGARRPPRQATPAMLSQLYAELGFPASMAPVHALALEHLAELVQDRLSMQELLFRDGRGFGALEAYQDNVFNTYLNAAAASLLASRAAHGPRPLRLLELGGGAGASTRAALAGLAGAEIDYLFTDLSGAFVRAAQERFKDTPGLRFGTLDINTEFARAKPSGEPVDVVLAANVLHNAEHTHQTLKRIRQMLSEGGWLVFTEATRETAAVLTGMQFLLSPAPGRPWPFRGDPRRSAGQVFLDSSRWSEGLEAAGFAPEFTLPPAHSPLGVAGQELFFAVAR